MAEKKSRRVQRPGAEGADPTPQASDAPVRASEDEDRSWGASKDSNDDRLKQDVPPHWS